MRRHSVAPSRFRNLGTLFAPAWPRRSSRKTHLTEPQYRTLFNSMNEGFCVIEFFDGPHGPLSDYIHVEANAAYTEHAGIPNVVGQKLREMVGEEADAWVAVYGGVLKTGEPVRFQRELVETGRYLDVAAYRIEPASMKQVAVLFTDVSARRRTEAALAETGERLRFLDALTTAAASLVQSDAVLAVTTRMLGEQLGAAVCAYADLDDDGQGFSIRGEWAEEGSPSLVGHYRLLGFGGRAVEGLRRGEPFIVNDINSDVPPGAAPAFRARSVAAMLCMPLIKDDRLVALMTITDRLPRRWSDREVGLLREVVTRSWAHIQRVRSEAELRSSETRLAELNAELESRVQERTGQLMQAEEALRQAQKMEAVGQLTGGIAHDFNNLLTGITGSLELLERRLASGRTAGLDRYIDAAQSSAKRAAALTQRLLAFSRRQTLDPRPLDANRLISGMEDLIRRSIGPTILLEVAHAGGLWTTRVDPGQLENALLNLCINARDAMAPGGGRLTIETANKWLDDRAARDRDLAPGQYVSICVTDTGAGMTPEVIDRAFDPFFTTKPLGQGTGLGLSMIYGFVRQSGGQVRIYSEVGAGTTMCLYLPRHLGPAEEDTHVPSTEPDMGHGETVVVIDDEPVVRNLVVEVLNEQGYRVLEAEDGPSGLKLLQSLPAIDLLITDVGLPGGMNGRQIADAARLQRPGLKVLFMTGYAENAVVGNGHLDLGMAIITKPFETLALGAKVREIIDSR